MFKNSRDETDIDTEIEIAWIAKLSCLANIADDI